MARHDFWQGMRGSLPVTLSASPFAVLFGAVAIDNGFSAFDAVLMSATVYAGASQLVGIELFGHHVAPWLIVLSVFAVNFRHVLYSASIERLIRHFSFPQKVLALFLLVDPQYAEAEKRSERGEPVSFSWYLGFALTIYVPWVIATFIGALSGRMIGDPKAIALDVLLPVYFMGLVMGFRQRDHWLPVVAVSSVVSIGALHVVGSPWHVSIGALAGIVLAACLPLPKRDEAPDAIQGEA